MAQVNQAWRKLITPSSSLVCVEYARMASPSIANDWDVPPPELAQPQYDPNAEPTPTPGELMVNELLELYAAGTMTASRLCTTCFYAAQAGVAEAKKYALSPTASSGHFQRKLDSALGFNQSDKHVYEVLTPMMVDHERVTKPVIVRPPHESLAQELKDDPSLLDGWAERIQDEQWVGTYENHPVIRGASAAERASILPVALYMDATEFSKRDSLLVFTLHLLVSRRRHLCFAVRKSSFCDCGCSGWCTLYPLFAMLHWSLSSLRLGAYPARRHDRCRWGDKDTLRRDLAGTPFGFSACVVDVCGDWAEFALRWGFPTWQARRPCFLCDCTQRSMREHAPVNVRTTEAYYEDCRACEVWVVVANEAMLRRVWFSLTPRRNKNGVCLATPIPELGLLAGDRLEPTAGLHDVYDVVNLQTPATLLFWRHASVPTVHRRHPLLCDELGIGMDMFTIDTLHTLHLGVFQFWLARCLWLFISTDAYSTGAAYSVDRISATLNSLMSELKDWYPAYEQSRPLTPQGSRKPVTRVTRITMSMLGTEAAPVVKLKGAETRHFIPFVLREVQRLREKMVGHVDIDALIIAGEALLEYTEILATQPRRIPRDVCTHLEALCKQHLDSCSACGIAFKPKHHLYWHLTVRIRHQGNPRMYSTYLDESLNRFIANTAGSCHRMTFERRLFAKVSLQQRFASKPVDDADSWW